MTLPPVRVTISEALRTLSDAHAEGVVADREYESSDAADEAYHVWESTTAQSLDRIFGERSVSNEFRSGMNVHGSGRRASAMFLDRQEKLLVLQSQLLLHDLHEHRGDLLASARQDQSHDPVLLLPVADADKLLTRQIHEGELLLTSLPRPQAMNDHAYREATRKESAYRDFNVQLLRAIFDRNDVADAFDLATTPYEFRMRGERIDWENLRKVRVDHGTDPKEVVIARVRRQTEELARWREKLPVVARIGSSTRPTENEETVSDNQVFLVHGHKTAILQEVARLIENLGLKPVILAEQPNAGATLIQKLESHAGVQFAIVLATADDIGSKALADQQQARARQNVIFELGFFVGRLGRDKVAVFLDRSIEIPSDFHGVAYHELDAQGGWKLALARELRAAGLNVDLNRLR